MGRGVGVQQAPCLERKELERGSKQIRKGLATPEDIDENDVLYHLQGEGKLAGWIGLGERRGQKSMRRRRRVMRGEREGRNSEIKMRET